MKPLLIADNQDITKAGLLYLLGSIKGYGETSEADNKRELILQLIKEPDNVVVLDYTHLDFSGLEGLINVS
jgi:hypothetical protein